MNLKYYSKALHLVLRRAPVDNETIPTSERSANLEMTEPTNRYLLVALQLFFSKGKMAEGLHNHP